MKKLLVFALFAAVAPVAAHADCSAKDFSLQDVKVAVVSGARMSIKGKLTNNCASAAAAQVKVAALDSSGSVLASRDGWPGGTTNISPGQTVDFDLGRLIHYQDGMANYQLTVDTVKVW